jgi:hypothetical protein
LTLVVAVVWIGWALIHQKLEGGTAKHPDHRTMVSERTTPHDTKRAPSLPAEDVAGKEIRDLPRYPGSVRAEYDRKEQDLLSFTRVRYLSRAKLDVIRGFYRGVFRTKGWKVANVEFSEGEWTFLVVHHEREADIEIEPRGRDVTKVDIEVSEPLPHKESVPPQRSHTAAPTSAPATESAPTPDDDEEGRDDLGDNEDGDD